MDIIDNMPFTVYNLLNEITPCYIKQRSGHIAVYQLDDRGQDHFERGLTDMEGSEKI